MLWIAILLSVTLSVTAQVLLKLGVNKIGVISFNMSDLALLPWHIISSGYIMSGLALYAISVVCWLIVLSRAPLSYAYPLVSIGYLVNTIIAATLLHEPVSFIRWLGVLVIMIGVSLIASSA